MTQDFNLRDKIFFSGNPDEDGDVCVSSNGGMIFMTRKEMRQLRDHLDALLAAEQHNLHPNIGPGTDVKVVKTSHSDLLGTIGVVRNITGSGNYEVFFKNNSESVIMGPEQVERA